MYYPKSQIIENLKSEPGELFNARTGEEYVGSYFKTSDNRMYTGKNPQDLPNNRLKANSPKELSKDSEPLPESYYIIDDAYYSAINQGVNRLSPRGPKSSSPKPNKSDYKLGEFQRYFLKKGNENSYLEVSKDEYELFNSKNKKVQWQSYIPLSINWILTGEESKVYVTNENIVELWEDRLGIFGFYSYFKGKFSQYHLDNKK